MADQHYRIEKIQKNGESTRTTVNLLTDEQAIEEIGRMFLEKQ